MNLITDMKGTSIPIYVTKKNIKINAIPGETLSADCVKEALVYKKLTQQKKFVSEVINFQGIDTIGGSPYRSNKADSKK